MRRFMGMMPSSEVSIEKRYVDKYGHKLTIQSGVNGWTVIYADNSAQFRDEMETSKKNFETAYKVAVENIGEITQC